MELTEDTEISEQIDTPKGAVSNGYYVINVTKSEISSTSAYAAIQSALDEAQENATTDLPYKVFVDPGKYSLTQGLRIYSNTYLCLTGVTLTQNKGSNYNMIKVGDSNDTHSGYYYQNITIDGGIWNENGNSNTAIKICHTQNITLMNATLKNCSNSHLMEIAGNNGITIQNCNFADQALSTSAKPYTYEAIQLDILLESHLSGYLSEDLPLKNVKITGCSFKNVPRGIGSHTAILNNPVDTIEISNNTFTSLKSLAIQAMNYINCTITGNTITDTPQGIMIYSVRESGTFLASTAVKEGHIPSSTPVTYQTPVNNQKMVISNNTIAASGNDPYEDYENAAIFVSGLNLGSATTGSGDTIPAGNYFISGITISDNTINTDGHGIRLQDARNSTITGNTITYSQVSKPKNTFYGIQLRESSTNGIIDNNTINKPLSGIHIFEKSSAKSISGNTVTTPTNNAIMIENASATNISSNTVNKPGINGIFIYNNSNVDLITDNNISAGNVNINIDGSTVTEISKNTLSSAKTNSVFLHNKCTVNKLSSNTINASGKHGVFIDCATAKTIKANTIQSPAITGVHVYNNSKVSTIANNQITSPGKYGICAEKSTARTISGNSISKPANTGIFIFTKSKTGTISDNTITSGKDKGIAINSVKCKLTISGNTIKKCKAYPIYCNPASTSYAITLKKNIITGNSKKIDGIRADSGKLILSSNTISSCSRAIILSSKVKGTVYPNTFKKNTYNNVKVNSSYVKTLTVKSLSGKSKSAKTATLNWKKLSSASGYVVYRSASKNGSYTKISTIKKNKTITYKDSKLKRKSTYYYKIVPYTTIGKTTVYGLDSKIVSIKIK